MSRLPSRGTVIACGVRSGCSTPLMRIRAPDGRVVSVSFTASRAGSAAEPSRCRRLRCRRCRALPAVLAAAPRPDRAGAPRVAALVGTTAVAALPAAPRCRYRRSRCRCRRCRCSRCRRRRRPAPCPGSPPRRSRPPRPRPPGPPGSGSPSWRPTGRTSPVDPPSVVGTGVEYPVIGGSVPGDGVGDMIGPVGRSGGSAAGRRHELPLRGTRTMPPFASTYPTGSAIARIISSIDGVAVVGRASRAPS